MKTIVTGAILALLAVGLISAAEARFTNNASQGVSGGQNITNGTSVAFSLDNIWSDIIFLGEKNVHLRVLNTAGGAGAPNDCITGSIEGVSGGPAEGKRADFTSGTLDTTTGNLVAGTYDVVCTAAVNTSPTTDWGRVTIAAPSYTVTLLADKTGFFTNEISGVSSGDSILVDATWSIATAIPLCQVDIVVVPTGGSVTNNKLAGNFTDWDNINVTFTSKNLKLSPPVDWAPGTYDFIIDPDINTCNGIDTPSSVLKKLTVTTAGITWDVDKTTAAINDIVKFTGKTSPFANVTITVASGTATQVSFSAISAEQVKYTNGSFAITPGGQGGTVSISPAQLNDNFSRGFITAFLIHANSDGTFSLDTKFADDGTYELQANGTISGSAHSQKKSVTISDAKATVRTSKTTAILGQEVKITGTVTAGSNVFISINDRLETKQTVKSDKTFEYTWSAARTAAFAEGSVRIDVWICPQTVKAGDTSACDDDMTAPGDGESGTATNTKDGLCNGAGTPGRINTTFCDTSAKKSPDASWSISMKDQTVVVTTPTAGQQVAEDDDLKVTGTAAGAANSSVYFWVFNSLGTTSKGTCFSGTISVASEESGFTFDKTLTKSDVTDDPGDYTLVVQSLGRDGKYSDDTLVTGGNGAPTDTTNSKHYGCADDAAVDKGKLNNKAGSQILAILQDNALNKAGSDDQKVFKVVQFKVVAPSIRLNACASTIKGADLNVSGTSNRADGTTVIVKATGPKELPPKTTSVKNGTFSATFTASEIGNDVGTYTVTADDLKGKTDQVTCSVISGSACALTVAVSSGKTQVEKDEKTTLTATLTNAGDEACAGTSLSSSVTPTTGTATWNKTSVDVPGKGSATVNGNFSASADGSYTVTVTATRGAATANGSATVSVGKVVATPTPTATGATPTPTATAAASPKPSPPGFEAVFAIAGLLAVAYLVNRRKR